MSSGGVERRASSEFLEGVVAEVVDAYQREVAIFLRGGEIPADFDFDGFARVIVEIVAAAFRERRLLSAFELGRMRTENAALRELGASLSDVIRFHHIAPRILHRRFFSATVGREARSVGEIRDATALVFALTSQIVAAVYGADVAQRGEALAPVDRGLVGRLVGGTVAAARAAESGETFFVRAPKHTVVVVGISDEGSPELTVELEQALTCLSEGSYRAVVAQHEGRVVAIAPIASRTSAELAIALGAALGDMQWNKSSRVVAGIGDPTPELTGLPRAYEQARRALEVVRELPVLGDVVTYIDSLPYQLLHSDPDRAADLASILAPLVVQDRQGQTNLLDTLFAVIAASGNLSEAAKYLNVHRQTLYARVARISDLTGKRVDDPDDFLLLHLAVHARRILSVREMPADQ